MNHHDLFDKKLSLREAKALAEHFIVFGVNAESNDSDPNVQKKHKKNADVMFKKIYYECIPAIHLANQLKVNHIEFITDESKHHDAVFYFDQVETVEVECVSAMHQKDGVLRLYYMKEFGSVSKYGVIKSSGKKGKRKFEKMENPSTTYEVEKERNIGIFKEKIPKAVKGKIETQERNNVYNKTILVVYIDDKYSNIHPNDFLPTLNEIVHSMQSLVHNFKGIYLVGTSGTVIPIKSIELDCSVLSTCLNYLKRYWSGLGALFSKIFNLETQR